MMRRSRRLPPRNAQSLPPRCEATPPDHHSPGKRACPQAQRPPAPPRRSASDDLLAEALVWFLYAPNWLVAAVMVTCYPALLTEQARDILWDAADGARRSGSEQEEVLFLRHLAFLERVRRQGIVTVLRELHEECQ